MPTLLQPPENAVLPASQAVNLQWAGIAASSFGFACSSGAASGYLVAAANDTSSPPNSNLVTSSSYLFTPPGCVRAVRGERRACC